MSNQKIEIGDIVTVRDTGWSYTTYKDMAKELGASHNWAYAKSPSKKFKYDVLNICEKNAPSNVTLDSSICLIRCHETLDEFLVGVYGLALHKKREESFFFSLKDEDLFV